MLSQHDGSNKSPHASTTRKFASGTALTCWLFNVRAMIAIHGNHAEAWICGEVVYFCPGRPHLHADLFQDPHIQRLIKASLVASRDSQCQSASAQVGHARLFAPCQKLRAALQVSKPDRILAPYEHDTQSNKRLFIPN